VGKLLTLNYIIMKYLIQDTEEVTLGEINSYFAAELAKTNLNKDDILVEQSLKDKVAMLELDRIFDENGLRNFTIDVDGMHLNHTGNFIEFSDNEKKARFDDAYACILSGITTVEESVAFAHTPYGYKVRVGGLSNTGTKLNKL